MTDRELLEKLVSSVGTVNDRLEKIENRLEKIETRLDNVETRLDKIETRLDNLEADMRMVKLELSKISRVFNYEGLYQNAAMIGG